MQTIITIEQLVEFCKKHHFYKFDAKDDNKRILVKIPAQFSADDDISDDFTLFGKVKLLHTGRNRNRSNVTEDAANGILDSIKYKPLLANFCEVDDEIDFTSHDMEIDEDGNITYIEHQVGCFTADEAYLEEDEDNGKKYIYANVAIPREYTDAASIIERKGGTKISAELFIKKMEYDVEEDELILHEIELLGATCLGKDPDTGEDVEEGMEGAFLEVKDSDTEQQYADFYKKYVRKEEQPVKIKYDENGEVIEETTDEVVEEEATEETKTEEAAVETEAEDNEADAGEEEAEVVENEETEEEATNEEEEPTEDEGSEEESSDDAETDNTFSVKFNGVSKEFAVSLTDAIIDITEKVNKEYSDDDCWYDVEVYDTEGYVVMKSWWTGDIYRQPVTKDEDGFYSLTDERVEVSAIYVTSEEEAVIKDALATARESATEDERYAKIADTDEYKKLAKDNSLSIAEFKEEADKLLLAYYEKNDGHQNFSTKKIASPFKEKSKSARYGTLFNK